MRTPKWDLSFGKVKSCFQVDTATQGSEPLQSDSDLRVFCSWSSPARSPPSFLGAVITGGAFGQALEPPSGVLSSSLSFPRSGYGVEKHDEPGFGDQMVV